MNSTSGAAITEFTVLELNTSIKELLSAALPGPFWIRGVITGLRNYSGRGHTYFQLADAAEPGEQSQAVVDCALFAGDKAAITVEAARAGTVFNLHNEMEVRILARVNFWERSGRFQIVMKGMDLDFAGNAAVIHLRRLVEKLSAEGVLEENGTLPMPCLPLTAGLVTAKGSAAERDFLKTLAESEYPFRVHPSYAVMQGVDTAHSVCTALTSFLSLSFCDHLDAVVLTRGGGSVTDLAWFNDERIARTISQLPWPVISAIGHEIDTTLPDHAAHTRAKTPTHAASLLVDRVAAFDEQVSRCGRELLSSLKPRLGLEKMRLEKNILKLVSAVKGIPGHNREKLEKLASAMVLNVRAKVHEHEKTLNLLEGKAAVRDPEKMLALGWAIVRDSEGKLISSSDSVRIGEQISVVMRKGSLRATVEEKHSER